MSSRIKSSTRQSRVRSQRRPKYDHDHNEKPQVNLPSPIGNLPIEMLSQIFEEYVGMDQSPCVLMLVSKQWNSLALVNPRLWTHIEIFSKSTHCLYRGGEYSTSDPTKIISTRGRFQLCETKDEVQAAFTRAGSLNMHLVYAHRYCGERIAGILNLALSSPLSSRIRSLELANISGSTHRTAEPVNMGTFPQLQHIFIREGDHWSGQFLHDILSASPTLQSLSIASNLNDDSNLFPLWNRLRILNISPHFIPPNIFDSIINRCSHLVEFSTYGYEWPNSQSNIGPKALSGVEKATLACGLPLLSKFQFRCLRSLNLRDTYHWAAIGGEVVRLDTVTSLAINLRHSSEGLRHLDIPNLEKLEVIRQGFRTDTGPDAFSSIRFPALVDLSVTADWQEQTFIDGLDGNPNIRNIEFILTRSFRARDRPEPNWDHLFEKLAGKGGHLVCAKLESLVLGSVFYPAKMRKSTLDRLVRHLNDYRTEESLERIRIELYNQGRRVVEVEKLQYNY